jgi:drug/metabolite transporter (DMT)-like permease
MATEVQRRHGLRGAVRPPSRPTTHRARKQPAQQRLSHLVPISALIGVAVVWGVSFSVVDYSVIDGGSGTIPPTDLVAWRFGLGTVLLLLIRTGVVRRQNVARLPAALRRRAVALGAFLGAGFLLQTWAMTYTDAMMSAFLTGLLVVIAPVAGWLIFRDRPVRVTWVAVAVATAGLAVLSLRGAGFGPGELITLLAAAMWAIHLVLLARWAKPEFAMELAWTQTATVTGLAVCTIAVDAVVSGRSPLPTPPADGPGWFSVAFLAVLATAGAMVLLSWAQSRMSATRAAIILTLEPAVAGVTAACLGSEFGLRTVAGGLLLLMAMWLVEVGGQRGTLAGRPHPDRVIDEVPGPLRPDPGC